MATELKDSGDVIECLPDVISGGTTAKAEGENEGEVGLARVKGRPSRTTSLVGDGNVRSGRFQRESGSSLVSSCSLKEPPRLS